MEVLIIKTSSMGDVLHTLPAMTDAVQAIPNIQFDWAVEPSFAEIPRWHPAVRDIIALPIRRWRKAIWKNWKNQEIQTTVSHLRQKQYDLVIDAQGLFKSAIFARLAKGKRVGYNCSSIREKIASLFYQKTYGVSKDQHAVERVRQLFSQALGYEKPNTQPDYGIDRTRLVSVPYKEDYLVFLHGTTWVTKHWPEKYWQQLAKIACKAGYRVFLPWGNETEHERAQNIAKGTSAIVLPKHSISEMASMIANAKGIVAVDTGLGHVAASMAVPTISLYGPTDPKLTGAYGPLQDHLSATLAYSPCFSKKCQLQGHFSIKPPCFESITPKLVWDQLLRQMNESISKCDVE